MRKACLCVESLLEYLGGRQLTVHRVQETWIETVTTIQHTRHEWNHFVTIIQSVLNDYIFKNFKYIVFVRFYFMDR